MTTVLVVVLGWAVTVWEGFVLKTLWAWFLVPQFGFPAIGMAHAVGLSLIVGLVTHQAPATDEDRTAAVMAWGVAAPLIALIAGWTAKQFL